MTDLKEIRISKNLTQKQACLLLGVSLRSYIMYETDKSKVGSLKYRFMAEQLEKYAPVDEEHGVLSLVQIQEKCKSVLDKYNVKYAILFGSYAKGTATETSDVDLLISTEVTGLSFFGMVEELREALKKKVDLLDLKQLNNNATLLDEILKEGIRVYEQPKR